MFTCTHTEKQTHTNPHGPFSQKHYHVLRQNKHSPAPGIWEIHTQMSSFQIHVLTHTNTKTSPQKHTNPHTLAPLPPASLAQPPAGARAKPCSTAFGQAQYQATESQRYRWFQPQVVRDPTCAGATSFQGPRWDLWSFPLAHWPVGGEVPVHQHYSVNPTPV